VSVRTHYLLHMAGVAILHLVAFSTFLLISGQFEILKVALPINLTVFIVINLSGAAFLFRPIQRYWRGQAGIAQTISRIQRLPRYSAGWAVFLVLSLQMIVFFGVGVPCPGCDPVVLAPFYFSMAVLFCSFVGIIIFFMIDDYCGQLRKKIYERFGDIVPPEGDSIRVKFVLAFTAVGIIPIALTVLEVFVFPEARRQQGMTMGQGFTFDFILISIMALSSFYFIQRNLSRPVESLLNTMRNVGEGNLKVKTPVMSDDEMGTLANGFNQMIDSLRDQEFIKSTFGRYVPEQVANAILESGGDLEPQSRLATILYTDIQGFTTICESLEPEDVVHLLNDYFSTIVSVIDQRGGVVNQFQGDALLVTFNVPVSNPNHAADAVQTALDIQKALETHTFKNDIQLVTRIGINTGQVVAGAVGATDRLNYTVHGDAVNTAARLESLNKEFGTRILASEDTMTAAGGRFEYSEKGSLPIRGKTEEVRVFEVLSPD